MKWRIVFAWVACFGLLGSVARADEVGRPVDSKRAKLRADVIRLRTEVDALQLDYDIARSDFIDDLKLMKSMEMASGLMAVGNFINQATHAEPDSTPGDPDLQAAPIAYAPLNPAEAPTMRPMSAAEVQAKEKAKKAQAKEKAEKQRAEMKAQQKAQAEYDKKAEAEKKKFIAEKKKKVAQRAASLIEKKLELEDAEMQYRQPSAPSISLQPTTKPTIPILGENATFLDPPSEFEISEKLPKADPALGKFVRSNSKYLVEKIGEKVDPCKIYPLAGPCQLVHCHYKCTVSFDETYLADGPIETSKKQARVVTIFINKDFLRRCVNPAQTDEKPELTAAPPLTITSVTETTPEAKIDATDAKLNLILKALEGSTSKPKD